jgi:hypothetical protein
MTKQSQQCPLDEHVRDADGNPLDRGNVELESCNRLDPIDLVGIAHKQIAHYQPGWQWKLDAILISNKYINWVNQ